MVLELYIGEEQKKAIAASVIAIIYVMLLALSCIYFISEDLIMPLHNLNEKMSEIMSQACTGKDGEEGEMDIDLL